MPPAMHISGTDILLLYSSCLKEYPAAHDSINSVSNSVYVPGSEIIVQSDTDKSGQSGYKMIYDIKTVKASINYTKVQECSMCMKTKEPIYHL